MTDRCNNTLLHLAQHRCAVREFSSRAIDDEVLQYILEVARLAPSAVNYQPWSFIVVRTPEVMKELHKVYPRKWFESASCCIVVCGNHRESWHRASDNKDHCDIDIAIATEHLALAATEQGLGCCWVCNFDVDMCRTLLNLPDYIEPMVLLPLGYPQDSSCAEKNRKQIDEIVVWR